MNRTKKLLFYTGIFIFSVFADRFTKLWMLDLLGEQSIMKISSYMNLSLVWNTGVSWSMFQPSSFFGYVSLTTIILIVLILFLLYVFDQYKNKLDISCEMLVLAGAISNFADRLWYGAVIDFLEFHVKTWYWPIFNVADVCVVVGVFGILTKSVGLWSKK